MAAIYRLYKENKRCHKGRIKFGSCPDAPLVKGKSPNKGKKGKKNKKDGKK